VLSYFFIDRPIFATVLSAAITIAGLLAWRALPVDQYPPITPPTVSVSCSYPGASAQDVADTVGAPIEQQMSGLEGMLYMSSNSGSDGSYGLTITFSTDTNVKNALVLVQNRVALAMPQLPQEVQRQTINVRKKSPSILLIISIASSNPAHNGLFLSNYATLRLKEEIARLPGVGDIGVMGQHDYSIRIWLDPEKLAARNLTAAEVIAALKMQSTEASAGQIGQMPAPAGQGFQVPLDVLGRLSEPEQFAETIVKVGVPDPVSPTVPVVRLRDIARVEQAAQQNDSVFKVDGREGAGIAIYQLPGSNALDTADKVKEKIEQLKAQFPTGMSCEPIYDTTPFIRESINKVYHTLIEATLLVALVVLVFLQSWRATLIPLAAVPVAIIGTLAAMLALGFSLNNLTLFGLVLAIGIVVDDAIVVVENVERWLEHGLNAREATRRAMAEVTGPVVAVALVLCAVFVPCAFLPGITGQFFRQFAVTIAVSTLLSAFNSLTLSPALAALLLRPHTARKDPLAALLHGALGWFFKLFNKGFDKGTAAYVRGVGWMLRLSLPMLLIYVGLLTLTYWTFTHTPTGFIPEQDKGYLLVDVRLPDSASAVRTQKVMADLEKIVRAVPGVDKDKTIVVSGQSLLLGANAPNFGSMYVILDDFSKRKGKGLTGQEIARNLEERFSKKAQDATVTVYGAPPVDGLGNAGGFKFMIEDRGNLGLLELQKVAEAAKRQGNATPGLENVATSMRADAPWYFLNIDRTRCMIYGVPLGEVFNALQVYLGSYYVNNFNEFGRSWQVNIQADASFRVQPPSATAMVSRLASPSSGLGPTRCQRRAAGEGATAIACTSESSMTTSAVAGRGTPTLAARAALMVSSALLTQSLNSAKFTRAGLGNRAGAQRGTTRHPKASVRETVRTAAPAAAPGRTPAAPSVSRRPATPDPAGARNAPAARRSRPSGSGCPGDCLTGR
jgi:hydrophobe/amphiphile efflux-1 (HAE1) family protein